MRVASWGCSCLGNQRDCLWVIVAGSVGDRISAFVGSMNEHSHCFAGRIADWSSFDF